MHGFCPACRGRRAGRQKGITSRIFRTFFWGLARSSSPLPEIRPSWEAFAHPRSGCLLWFLVTKRILFTHETSSHEDSAPTDHFRRAGARASKFPAGAELLKGRLVQRPHIKIAFDNVQNFSHIFLGSPGQVLLCLKSGHHERLSRTRGPDVYPGFW